MKNFFPDDKLYVMEHTEDRRYHGRMLTMKKIHVKY